MFERLNYNIKEKKTVLFTRAQAHELLKYIDEGNTLYPDDEIVSLYTQGKEEY